MFAAETIQGGKIYREIDYFYPKVYFSNRDFFCTMGIFWDWVHTYIILLKTMNNSIDTYWSFFEEIRYLHWIVSKLYGTQE